MAQPPREVRAPAPALSRPRPGTVYGIGAAQDQTPAVMNGRNVSSSETNQTSWSRPGSRAASAKRVAEAARSAQFTVPARILGGRAKPDPV